MCGRYSLFAPPKDLGSRFDVRIEEYTPRYNAAPGQQLPVITDEQPDQLHRLEWGLIPQWAEKKSDGGHINARAETVAEKASFRDAFEQRNGEFAAGRCLVPADGFYEWVEQTGGKQPYRVTLDDERPFLMAGLWTAWEPPTTQTGLDAFRSEGSTEENEVIETFTIVTTEPNEFVADLHHRMAVILPEDNPREWLTAPPERARELLEPYPAEEMDAYPVSTAVNDPANDSPAVLEPAE